MNTSVLAFVCFTGWLHLLIESLPFVRFTHTGCTIENLFPSQDGNAYLQKNASVRCDRERMPLKVRTAEGKRVQRAFEGEPVARSGAGWGGVGGPRWRRNRRT